MMRLNIHLTMIILMAFVLHSCVPRGLQRELIAKVDSIDKITEFTIVKHYGDSLQQDVLIIDIQQKFDSLDSAVFKLKPSNAGIFLHYTIAIKQLLLLYLNRAYNFEAFAAALGEYIKAKTELEHRLLKWRRHSKTK